MLVAANYRKQMGSFPSDVGKGIFFHWYCSLISRAIDGICRKWPIDQLQEAMKAAWAMNTLWLDDKHRFRLQADSVRIINGMKIRLMIAHYGRRDAESVGTGTIAVPCVFGHRDGDLASYFFADGTMEKWRHTELTGWYRDHSNSNSTLISGVTSTR